MKQKPFIILSCLLEEKKHCKEVMVQVSNQTTMALIGLFGSSQFVLKEHLRLSGFTRLNLEVGNCCSIMPRARLLTNSQYKYDEKQMSRRVMLQLVTTGLATSSLSHYVFAKVKPVKVESTPPSSIHVKYLTTSCHSSSNYHYFLFPILFITK